VLGVFVAGLIPFRTAVDAKWTQLAGGIGSPLIASADPFCAAAMLMSVKVPASGIYSFSFIFLHRFAENLSGNSSPSIGGIRLPTRARICLTFGGLARRARSSKYSDLRNADTFSASARVIS
jgi:hypothetical protein